MVTIVLSFTNDMWKPPKCRCTNPLSKMLRHCWGVCWPYNAITKEVLSMNWRILRALLFKCQITTQLVGWVGWLPLIRDSNLIKWGTYALWILSKGVGLPCYEAIIGLMLCSNGMTSHVFSFQMSNQRRCCNIQVIHEPRSKPLWIHHNWKGTKEW